MGTLGRHCATASAYAVFIHAMLENACSVDDLCEETGLARMTIYKLIHAHRREHLKSLYIASWTQDVQGRTVIAQYRVGNKPDVPQPPRTPRNVILKRYRQRRKAGLTPCTMAPSPMVMYATSKEESSDAPVRQSPSLLRLSTSVGQEAHACLPAVDSPA